MGLMFYIGPTVGAKCSVRLTGTSSCATSTVSLGLLPTGYLWNPAKKRTKRRPSGRLHSDAQVSQQETPKLFTYVSEHRVCHSEGGKMDCVLCVCSLPQAKIFPSHLYVTLKPKVRTLFPTFSALFKLPKHLKRLKAPLITNVTHSISVFN